VTTPATINAVLRDGVAERPDALAISSGGMALTYRQLDELSDRFAQGLRELGVEAGDRVAVLSANRAELPVVWFACAKLGAPDVPLNAFLRGEFLRHQLDDSGAKVLVVDEGGLRSYAQIRDEFPIENVIALDPGGDVTASYSQLIESPPLSDPFEPTADTLLSILYTSGTTGLPKGCMMTHGYILFTAQAASEAMGVVPGDVMWTATPFYHSTGRTAAFLASMFGGGATELEPVFSASTTRESWHRSGATIFYAVGPMGLALLALPESELDRGHKLRITYCGLLTEEQEDEFQRRFGTPIWYEIYGQTECQPICFTLPTDKDRPRGRLVLGRAHPQMDVRLVDDDEEDVPLGEAGEVIARPRTRHAIYGGYWGRPGATLASWTGLWHHTGDLATCDAGGTYTFVDRKKDALRRRGENIASAQLEAAIAQHPAIAEVAVHGVPAAVEDDIKACLVLEPDATVAPPELFDFFVAKLPYFAVPRYVEVVPSLPRNASARVMKHELRDRGVTEETWDFVALGLRISKADRR
jgi:crotonobetaine/carnitine-CoA ligase